MMNLDYKIGLIVIFVTALCITIPKSFHAAIASDRLCPIVEEPSNKQVYYSQNFALETQ
ncbi:MAG: hypothetical protein IGS39_08150 [Calothrix sp. C42_A2020_038]|nr:hypothetical protein [Calothrix sp. C42_A2020_038]